MHMEATVWKMGTVERPCPPSVERLYEAERGGLIRLAMLLVGDRGVAEDLVHDAFVGLQSRWKKLSDPQSAGGYLRNSVVNGARSRRRRAVVAMRHPEVAVPSEEPGADVTTLLADEHRAVIDAVRRLPARQREVLVLRYWLDLTEAEIAAAMGVSAGTVKSTASRALDALERLLEVTND